MHGLRAIHAWTQVQVVTAVHVKPLCSHYRVSMHRYASVACVLVVLARFLTAALGCDRHPPSLLLAMSEPLSIIRVGAVVVHVK